MQQPPSTDAPRLDSRPTAAGGWLPVLLRPRLWPRWLPRAALSSLCWLLGHKGKQIYIHGCVSVECARCGMRLMVLRAPAETP
jgi:hypothetical protein